jgi:cbb3-type cytochrome oxidase subunit 3
LERAGDRANERSKINLEHKFYFVKPLPLILALYYLYVKDHIRRRPVVQELPQLISILSILLLLGFWFWMFRDMAKNASIPDNYGPPLTWPPASKYTWTLVFILLNVFGAGIYYVFEYRNRQ